MGGGVVQVVTVPWGWYFVGTVGLVPWVGKAVPWGSYRGRERRYREAGAVQGRRYRGVGTVGRKGGTVGGDVVQIVVVPWGWYFRGTVEMVPWRWYRGRWCCADTVRVVHWSRRCGGTVRVLL